MYDVDFLAVENETRDGTKSGDAIIVNIPDRVTSVQRRVIVDAGFAATGQTVVNKFRNWYGSDAVDLVISTHPDSDHLNGLQTVIETLNVGELMLHLPWEHDIRAHKMGNYERIVDLQKAAARRGTRITEPFAGIERFSGALTVLGPTRTFYEAQLRAAIDEVETGAASTRVTQSMLSALLAAGKQLLEKSLSYFPVETLDDVDDTGPRNQTSVVTLVTTPDRRMMLTGDAGIAALAAAADVYEGTVGPFGAFPLAFFQAPHHGSKHNLGPAILDRILGQRGAAYAEVSAFISSAKASDKHPSPKVTNALGRRGATVIATEGKNIHHGESSRPGYTPCTPVGPLMEDDDV
ncbi:ComEC/Rec2 family competence protein [Pseudactinotalea suaedae]|uniref:ComEC/Rec2 family competence protein n=1 Tax=Pseudactinotalea suaedae TaxID=1524924 RepID=UPI0012E28427|nr:MBL fold metallo-hydrolase [Pseudactinotalea suaedae]